MRGGCVVQCQQPSGAVVCNGQFVDHGGNAEECLNALRALVEVDASARGSASSECSGGTCTAEAEGEAKASASCTMAQGRPARGGLLGLGLLLGVGALVRIRRRAF
jgi:hypothetical protein